MRFFKVLGVGVVWLVLISLFVLLFGLVAVTISEVWTPKLSCSELPWETVVDNYQQHDRRDQNAGRCLIAAVKNIEQAQKVIGLARQAGDERTETWAVEEWQNIVMEALPKVQTCGQAKNVWSLAPPNLKERAYLKVAAFCVESSEPAVKKEGGR